MEKDLMDKLLYILIFCAVIGTIAAQVTDASNNVSGAAKILLGLTTIFVVIGFIRNVAGKSKGK